MFDPAPFRLSLPQARRLGLGIAVCATLSGLAFVVGIGALADDDMRRYASGPLAGSVLVGMLGLGLYVRRALGLAHQRQLKALAWLTDPNADEATPSELDPADPADPAAEIPSPRPGVEPEPSRKE